MVFLEQIDRINYSFSCLMVRLRPENQEIEFQRANVYEPVQKILKLLNNYQSVNTGSFYVGIVDRCSVSLVLKH